MHSRLPGEVAEIRHRMVKEQIARRRTVEVQVEGLAGLWSAFWEVLSPMIGGVATGEVMKRAALRARQKYPQLNGLVAVQGGIDAARLLSYLEGEDPDITRNLLYSPMEELFSLLYGLLGETLVPILREIEAALAVQQGPSEKGKEQ